MWYSSVERLNRLPHQVPSLNQSLLWGFSPVGAITPLALNEKSRYPISLRAAAPLAWPPTFTRAAAATTAINRSTRLIRASHNSVQRRRARRLLEEYPAKLAI